MNQTIIYILIAFTISFGLTLLALFDSLKKDFKSTKAKLIWHVIALIPFLGWIIYFVFGAKQGKKQTFK